MNPVPRTTNVNYDLGPRPHGIYSDRDRHGNPRIAVTLPRKGRRGGIRLRTLTGHLRNIAFPISVATSSFDHTGRRMAFDADSATIRVPRRLAKNAAVQMILLMDAVSDLNVSTRKRKTWQRLSPQ